MKKIVFLFALASLILTGCPKHEIVPVPTQKADLSSHFVGLINGTDVELTQNVGGYNLYPTKQTYILPLPAPSGAVYFAEMKSPVSKVAIKVGFGAVTFDGTITQEPTITLFNDFFTNNLTPNYSTDGLQGFEVIYTDGTGAIWKSDPATPLQNVEFSEVEQVSDAAGDYSKFLCTFDCMVMRTVGTNVVSLPIQNAALTGWFKR